MGDAGAALDDRSTAVLAFERDWALHEGRKNEAIRERFGITPARYYQLLNRTLEDPRAEALDPLLVRRLRRRRAERAQRREARLLGQRPGP